MGNSKGIKNGKEFENCITLKEKFKKNGYKIQNETEIFYNDEKIEELLIQYKLYTSFLKEKGFDYNKELGKKWIPDEVFINEKNKKIYIIEKKYQECAGSVDEKLPNCHYKKQWYKDLLNKFGYDVEFIYFLSNYFKENEKRYKDIKNYVINVCKCQWHTFKNKDDILTEVDYKDIGLD